MSTKPTCATPSAGPAAHASCEWGMARPDATTNARASKARLRFMAVSYRTPAHARLDLTPASLMPRDFEFNGSSAVDPGGFSAHCGLRRVNQVLKPFLPWAPWPEHAA